MHDKRSRGVVLRRAAACSLGTLLAIGLAAVPAAAAVPDSPTSPAAAQGNGTIVVSYSAPGNDGGFPIDQYTAACLSSDGGAVGSGSTPDGTPNPITVTGVTLGKTYTCHVLAHNSDGFSAQSVDTAPPVVVVSAPAAPPQPAVTAGTGSLSVSFGAAANNGGAITGYEADCTSSDTGVFGSNTGTSPIVVSGLTNLSTYTCTVKATNAFGTGPSSAASDPVVVGSPGATAQPTVMGGGAQITVSFGAAADNGNTVDFYFAACVSNNGGGTKTNTGTSPIVVPGAINGATYTCYTRAHNAGGFGPQSPNSIAVVPGGQPDPPAVPTVAPANKSIVVTFVAPNDNGSPITSYEADCASSDGGAPGTKTGTASPLTVTGLTNGNTYTCTVSAFNAVGGSTSTESAEVVPLGVPDAPAKPTVARGNGRIIVTFDSPNDNGDPIFSYSATCTSSNGGVAKSHDGFFSPITVTGLSNGKTYTCRANATSDTGTGPFSVPSNAIVPLAAPSTPTGVAVVSGSAPGSTGPLTVSYRAASGNGSAVTSYRATCKRASDGKVTTKTGTGTSLVVPGLSAGKTYACTVVAISAGGTSAPSAPVSAKVGAPGRPAIIRVLKQSAGLTFQFVPPNPNGKPITVFTVRCSSSNGGINRGKTGFSSPITVKNMTPGTTYTCKLTATNARGEGAPSTAGPLAVTR